VLYSPQSRLSQHRRSEARSPRTASARRYECTLSPIVGNVRARLCCLDGRVRSPRAGETGRVPLLPNHPKVRIPTEDNEENKVSRLLSSRPSSLSSGARAKTMGGGLQSNLPSTTPPCPMNRPQTCSPPVRCVSAKAAQQRTHSKTLRDGPSASCFRQVGPGAPKSPCTQNEGGECADGHLLPHIFYLCPPPKKKGE
jgi:hypothetical protein